MDHFKICEACLYLNTYSFTALDDILRLKQKENMFGNKFFEFYS